MSEEQQQIVRNIIRDEFKVFLATDRFIFDRLVQHLDGRNIQYGLTTGTKFGTKTTQKMGWYNATPIVQPTNGVDLTNNVTAGGTNDTIANFTDLSTYANDSAAIRNDIHQLARKLKVVNDSLRDLGLNS